MFRDLNEANAQKLLILLIKQFNSPLGGDFLIILLIS
jgi:hypothetical protein